MFAITFMLLVVAAGAFQSSPYIPYLDISCDGASSGGDCYTSTELVGPTICCNDAQSQVLCPNGQHITFCECIVDIPHQSTNGAYCDGVKLNAGATSCTAYGAHEGGSIKVRAICGVSSGAITVLSHPTSDIDVDYITDPSVTCSPGQTLRGCYVHTWAAEDLGHSPIAIRDDETCKTTPTCAACRVQAVCEAAPSVPDPADFCACSSVVLGGEVSTANGESQVNCPADEVITHCECLKVDDSASCGGVRLVGVDTCISYNSGNGNGAKTRARACCGRVDGTNSIEDSRTWNQHETDQGGDADPSVTCPPGAEMLFCYAHAWWTTDYTSEGSHLETTITGDTCTAAASCTTCYLSAFCFQKNLCPVDGVWSDWTDYGDCSQACGDGGTQERQRDCNNPAPADGGEQCVLLDGSSGLTETQSQPCNIHECPIHGGWGTSGVTGCSDTCGGGTKTETRYCNNPIPEHGGDECLFTDQVTRGTEEQIEHVCNEQPCPVDGDWTTWEDITACSVECGTGTLTQERACTNPEPEHGGDDCTKLDGTQGPDETKEVDCNTNPCPTHGGWGPTSLSTCDKVCGGGNQVETKHCNNPVPADGGDECLLVDGETRALIEEINKPCNPEPCPVGGGWGDWEVTQGCADPCNTPGTQVETRYCNSPEPQNGGTCTLRDETQGLEESKSADCCYFCPVHGGWSTWVQTSDCSATCGGGTLVESRTCTNPLPSNGGNQCTREDGSIGLCESRAIVCNTDDCPTHGGWSDWVVDDPCDEPCGGGTEVLRRDCNNPEPDIDGDECLLEDDVTRALFEVKTVACNTHECPVDGVWSTWVVTVPCSEPCDGGIEERTRNCDSPAPQNDGAECLLEDGTTGLQETKTVPCNEDECPIDGGWSSWSSVDGCTVPCDGGTESQARQCNNPSPQNGGADCTLLDGSSGLYEELHDVPCNEQPCTADGVWSTWVVTVPCSVPCGGGIEELTRNCDSPAPQNGGADCLLEDGTTGLQETKTAPCNEDECPTDGGWSTWSSVDGCSAPCGGGTESQVRQCNNPTPENGGAECTLLDGTTGLSEERHDVACNEQPCIVDGGWSTWVVTVPCSVPCGGGIEERTRNCDSPPPPDGGEECTLEDGTTGLEETKTVPCNEDPCPNDGGWSTWSSVDGCTVPCDGGTESQVRQCNNPTPENGGAECTLLDGTTGLSEERHDVACNEQPCNVDGGWSDWSGYGECSVSCGGGIQIDERYCNNPMPVGNGAHCERLDTTLGLYESREQACNEQACPDPATSEACDELYGPGATVGYSKIIQDGNCRDVCSALGMACRMSVKTYPDPTRRQRLGLSPYSTYNGRCTTIYSNGCCCESP